MERFEPGNNRELTDTMNRIQLKKATLEVLNLPALTGIGDDNLRRLLNNLIIELYNFRIMFQLYAIPPLKISIRFLNQERNSIKIRK